MRGQVLCPRGAGALALKLDGPAIEERAALTRLTCVSAKNIPTHISIPLAYKHDCGI
jgi:hypothetical protein